MDNAFVLALSAFAGVALGFFFYGGLWWTIKKGVASEKPFYWFLGSLFIRSAVALSCFYLFSQYGYERLLACLLGFFASHAGIKFILFPAEARAGRR
ncbi:MAG TPA: ATP synthase subunit I [Candidatus Wallbacteria bacterium]|nr:ATP synthase subunit I [Candidatus Wallbacteria bacterium]